ncbi:hypothetical protein HFN69_31690 [Rhizobium laguerreae]|uniref:DUF4200 domain-containing protein n=1 Tax=Rhizobium laguerreae TaxID=1076926 RepID=UPI001C920110|nr:DUF4200 domain-containing protein [Rhizobium laguerreae]MBY3544442.1 hypothetical protein [Rhizobium laguerreae]MBY3551100.1 hypothetical protein [Rhizobium laguerreae]
MIVGFSARDISFDDLIEHLRNGSLSIPSRGSIDAVEVRPNFWITSGFMRLPNGNYGLTPQTSIRAVPVVKMESRPDLHRLSNGLVLMASQPRWSFAEVMDIRSEAEITQSTEEWLSRIAAAAVAPNSEALLDQFKAVVASSVGESEREDLQSALRLLSSRTALLDVIPKMMAGDGAWKEGLEAFRRSEHDRLREEVRKQLAAEAEEHQGMLTSLKEKIAEAEASLATIAHREVLLRNETAQHEANLREKIAEVARVLSERSSGDARRFTEQIEQLQKQVVQLEEAVAERPEAAPTLELVQPSPVSNVQSQSTPVAVASNDDQQRVLKELSAATGLTETELMAALLFSVESVPVVVGDRATGLAADIATAVGGGHAAVLFCGPTHVTLHDLLNDELGGLREAVEFARQTPEALVPVALCGITSSPCEFWLPQLVELRRIGRLPSNLSIIASAGPDGMRVPVPTSVLQHLFPISPALAPKPGSVNGGSHQWPGPTDTDIERRRAALDVLTDMEDVGASFHKKGSRILSRLPIAGGLKLTDVAGVLVRQIAWSTAVGERADHPLNKYFQNFGG